jgi:hypothetical protein
VPNASGGAAKGTSAKGSTMGNTITGGASKSMSLGRMMTGKAGGKTSPHGKIAGAKLRAKIERHSRPKVSPRMGA